MFDCWIIVTHSIHDRSAVEPIRTFLICSGSRIEFKVFLRIRRIPQHKIWFGYQSCQIRFPFIRHHLIHRISIFCDVHIILQHEAALHDIPIGDGWETAVLHRLFKPWQSFPETAEIISDISHCISAGSGEVRKRKLVNLIETLVGQVILLKFKITISSVEEELSTIWLIEHLWFYRIKAGQGFRIISQVEQIQGVLVSDLRDQFGIWALVEELLHPKFVARSRSNDIAQDSVSLCISWARLISNFIQQGLRAGMHADVEQSDCFTKFFNWLMVISIGQGWKHRQC